MFAKIASRIIPRGEKMKETPVHHGHRQRLKARFLQEGIDGFNEINALELLLFYCIPKQDTNEIAHRLLQKFGSFARVLDAEPEELMSVKGIGEHAAVFFSLIRQSGRYYQTNRSEKAVVLTSIEKCGEYMQGHFQGRTRETVVLLCLDGKCTPLCCESVCEGNVNSAGISIRKIVEIALKANASQVVLAHNHPSGIAIPSDDDVQTTYQLARALRALDIKLVDHLVFADGDYVSMSLSSYYSSNEI
jgi:DNA repair protein RadC